MRTFVFWALVAGCGAGMTGCEDNPDQIYKRAPPGAADKWNDGRPPSTFDPNAKNAFTDSFNAKSKQDLCSGAEKHERWAEMDRQPLIPPRMVAGIDLAGNDSWPGLDFRKAEEILCQSKAQAIADPELLGAAWGDTGEVSVDYSIATNTITDWTLGQGYRGKLVFEGRENGLLENGAEDRTGNTKNPWGKHRFELQISTQILKDGRPYEIHWQDDCKPKNKPGDSCWQLQLTEMYDAMMATFGKELPSTQGNCVMEQKCLGSKAKGNEALFGVRPLGTYFIVPNWTVQPAGSTPKTFYGSYVKLMPFSSADLYMKLDDVGPMAISPSLGTLKKRCEQTLGLQYGDFLANCVNVSADKKENDFVFGKMKGGMSHTKEAFNFSVEAVKLDFLSTRIGEDRTVGDDWEPQPDDVAYEWEMDIRASGKVLNEWTADKKFQTLAATGAIYREYARRVQKDIRAKVAEWLPLQPASSGGACKPGWELVTDDGTRKCRYKGFDIGDPHCLIPPALSIPVVVPEGASAEEKRRLEAKENKRLKDRKNWPRDPACTGFESFITPGSHEHINMSEYPSGGEPLRVSLGWRAGPALGIKTALKAGDPLAFFCDDPPPNTGRDSVDGEAVTCEKDDDCWSAKCETVADGGRVCADPTDTYFFNACADDGNGNKVLSASHKRVVDVLGQSKELALPPALRDRKFYFRHLAAAIVKYLKAAPKDPSLPQPKDLADPEYMPGGTACVPPGVLPKDEPWNCEPEPDHLLFDQVIEDSDRDKWEYIDRRFAKNGKEPMKVEYEILINSSNQQNWKFHRKLTRPERKLYEAMKGDNVRLSNLVGSPVIASNWKGVEGNPTKDAHYCGSKLFPEPNVSAGETCRTPGRCERKDPQCPVGPPRHGPNGPFMLDDYDMPLLTNYRGAFAGTGTAFALGSAHMRMVEELPLIKSARVQLPMFADPYATRTGRSTGGPPMPTIIADWRPKTPGNGIRIPVNEQLDRFVPSASIVFGGSSLTLDLDYVQQDNGTMRLEAVQSDSYSGNIFLCMSGGDLLSVEQYESMDVIQDWLNTHPGAREECDIVTRFSAFGEYPQLFAVRNAGAVLSVGLGSGVGRVTQIRLYDPSIQ